MTICLTSCVDLDSGKHWKIALCSLSIGTSSVLFSLTVSISNDPPATILSLLARRIFLPDFAAWKVDLIPAKPDMAEITISTSLELKISESSFSSSQITASSVFSIFSFADLSFM